MEVHGLNSLHLTRHVLDQDLDACLLLLNAGGQCAFVFASGCQRLHCLFAAM